VDYFADRGSNVYAAALDISEAYDRISQVRLFTSLLRTGMPRWVVYLLVDSYSKLQVVDPLAVVISHCGWLITAYGWLAG
jgi:hypothetical protein